MHVNPFVHFNGNCEEAFTFYKSVFGGEFSTLKRFKELNNPEFGAEAEKILQVALPIGQQSHLMGSDTPSFMGTHNLLENRSKMYLTVASKDEGKRVFEGLSVGGTVEMPFEENFAMFRDKYGVEWMMSVAN